MHCLLLSPRLKLTSIQAEYNKTVKLLKEESAAHEALKEEHADVDKGVLISKRIDQKNQELDEMRDGWDAEMEKTRLLTEKLEKTEKTKPCRGR